MTDVGALIIASASGYGFGGALALGTWHGGSVLEHVVAVLRAGRIDDITVVLGPRADDIVDTADLGDATLIIDSDWGEGSAASLRAGLDTMWRSKELAVALIVELDRPDIDGGTIAAILSAHRGGTTPVTVPKYRYTRGGPVAIARTLWPRLMSLEGHVDLGGLIEAHREWATEVWIDRVPPARVETVTDLEAVIRPV